METQRKTEMISVPVPTIVIKMTIEEATEIYNQIGNRDGSVVMTRLRSHLMSVLNP